MLLYVGHVFLHAEFQVTLNTVKTDDTNSNLKHLLLYMYSFSKNSKSCPPQPMALSTQ